MMKKVLVVDDVSTNLRCLRMILEKHYELKLVKSGAQALECIREFAPDLILLDVCMDEMNGYEVLQEIRQNADMQNIPVIITTANTEPECEDEAYRLGADGFAKKPFVPQAFLRYVETILTQEDES